MSIEQKLLLEEAITALREEMIKDLAESLPINVPFRETLTETNELLRTK